MVMADAACSTQDVSRTHMRIRWRVQKFEWPFEQTRSGQTGQEGRNVHRDGTGQSAAGMFPSLRPSDFHDHPKRTFSRCNSYERLFEKMLTVVRND